MFLEGNKNYKMISHSREFPGSRIFVGLWSCVCLAVSDGVGRMSSGVRSMSGGVS